MTKRRSFLDQSKAAVALEALRGDKTVQEIAARHWLDRDFDQGWHQNLNGSRDIATQYPDGN